jgi:uncharacterized protein YjbJ (UPF0337 family)
VDKDKLKGKTNEAVGATRQKAGEMTGNEEMESKGAAQETKGKAQGAMGAVKEKAGDLKDKITGN